MTTVDPVAVYQLYHEWLPTIRGYARRLAPFTRNGLTYEDLVQAASLAFLTTVDRWDRTHAGHRTWMRRVISTAMSDALRSQQNTVRIPRDVWVLRADVANTEGALIQQLRREPTVVELAHALDADPRAIVEMRSKTMTPQSLDVIRPDSGDLALELSETGSWEMADQIASRIERQQHVGRLLDGLPHATAHVMRLKWGLDANGYELGVNEIAKQLRKSTEWVRLRLREAERHILHVGPDRTRRRNLTLTATDLRHLLPTKDLSWYNLNGASLAAVDLAGVDLTSADLANADLHEANLNGANLRRANLNGANLSGADLSGADLAQANFSRANLTGAILPGVRVEAESVPLAGSVLRVSSDSRGASGGAYVEGFASAGGPDSTLKVTFMVPSNTTQFWLRARAAVSGWLPPNVAARLTVRYTATSAVYGWDISGQPKEWQETVLGPFNVPGITQATNATALDDVPVVVAFSPATGRFLQPLPPGVENPVSLLQLDAVDIVVTGRR